MLIFYLRNNNNGLTKKENLNKYMNYFLKHVLIFYFVIKFVSLIVQSYLYVYMKMVKNTE